MREPQDKIWKEGSGIRLGVMRISGSLESLEAEVRLSPYEKEVYSGRKKERKRREWLTVRKLLYKMLGHEDEEIRYRGSKPFLKSGEFHLSVSHSGDYVVVMLNKEASAGVDIEKVREGIVNTAGHFLNETELKRIGANPDPRVVHMYWGAKEAMYKYSSEGEYDFINSYHVEVKKTGESGPVAIKGIIKTREKTEVIHLRGLNIGDYVLVYTLNKE